MPSGKMKQRIPDKKSRKSTFCLFLKRILLFVIPFLAPSLLFAQQADSLQPGNDDPIENRIEYLSEQTDSEIDFSEWTDELKMLAARPVNLNSSSEDELRKLFFLNDQQIDNLLDYHRKYGNLATIYELHFVDGFNEALIMQILPYISLSEPVVEKFSLKRALKYGGADVMIRYQRIIEQQQGFAKVSDSIRQQSPNKYFLGSPDALYLRFTYSYKDRMQIGFVADKDAGETLFPAADTLKNGFDYYSFHFYLKDIGHLKHFAIGDYHLQFGQGLTLWTGLSFSKSPAAIASRKRSPAVRPHASANEYNFFRGTAATYSLKMFDITGFYSNRNIDGNYYEADTILGTDEYFTSIIETGYHRTPGELADKGTVNQQIAGGHISYNGQRLRLGATGYHSLLNHTFDPSQSLYNQFESTESQSSYFGIDYSYSYKRLTVYGETSKQLNGGLATVDGLSLSPDPRFAMSLIYRNYAKDYTNHYAVAFGEGSKNTNEKGLYFGITATPFKNVAITAYTDYFRYDWLRYRVDAPSSGNENSLQVVYNLGRKGSVTTRYRRMNTPIDFNDGDNYLNPVENVQRDYYQLTVDYQALSWLKFRNRIYFLQRQVAESGTENGFFISQDLIIRPEEKPYSFTMRYALFDADSYDARIYTYENDLPYTFSVPSFSGKGSRFYAMVKISLARHTSLWLRYSITSYFDRGVISSGTSEIDGNHKSDFKAMLKFSF
jgi:DNA uptake protein ComE-like DNA-binding protein